MLKHYLLKLIIALTLMVAIIGTSGIVADEFGLQTSQPVTIACDPGGSGGCG